MGSGKEDMMVRLMLALYCSDVELGTKGTCLILKVYCNIVNDPDCPTV